MVEPQAGGTYKELLAAAKWAEAAGLAAFARSDHYYVPRGSAEPADDAFTALGGIARDIDHPSRAARFADHLSTSGRDRQGCRNAQRYERGEIRPWNWDRLDGIRA